MRVIAVVFLAACAQGATRESVKEASHKADSSALFDDMFREYFRDDSHSQTNRLSAKPDAEDREVTINLKPLLGLPPKPEIPPEAVTALISVGIVLQVATMVLIGLMAGGVLRDFQNHELVSQKFADSPVDPTVREMLADNPSL